MSAAIQALREYAQCLRGDWSDFDGRGNKAVLDDLAEALENPDNFRAEWTVEQWRMEHDICPTTGAHWTYHCGEPLCANGADR